MGFDVAGYAPFWSIVADVPSDELEGILARVLNANGLIATIAAAEAFLSAYRRSCPEDADLDLFVWRVWLIPHNGTALAST